MSYSILVLVKNIMNRIGNGYLSFNKKKGE